MKNSPGRILYASADALYKSIDYGLYISKDQGNNWQLATKIPFSGKEKLMSLMPLVNRVLRKGIYKMLKYHDQFVVFANRGIYRFNPATNNIEFLGLLQGSRPLYPCIHNDALYYGEYKGNPERGPIHIHRYDFNSKAWSVCYTFDNIRHIHGIISDPYNPQRLWVTTGDLDNECHIYHSDDDFNQVTQFAGGTQHYRAIYLHFSETTITYGTDAPDDKNYIFEISREDGSILNQWPVSGPIFFGAQTPQLKVLSTAVEPTEVNETKFMELWACKNDENDNNWHRAITVNKDILPKKLFQYGQIVFPDGPGIDGYLLYTVVAGKNHNSVMKVAVNELID